MAATTTLTILTKYRKEGTSEERVAEDAALLGRIGKRLHRLAEQECSRELRESEEDDQAALAALAREVIAKRYDGLGVMVNGDPRGYALKLRCRDGEYNTWGGAEHGFGVDA